MKPCMKSALAAVGVAMLPIVGTLEAQTPPPRDPSAWPGKVYLSGENPGITLREKAGGAPLANVSFWRVHWSPVGAGHVCYVTTGDGKGPRDLRIGIYDNQKLYDYLTKQMMMVFNKGYQDRPFTPVGGGTFGHSGDAIREYREVCNSDRYKVELTWRALAEPYIVNRDPGRPENPFGLVYLRIPSSQAEISINGARQPGGVFADASGGGGAILAFGETWRRE